MEILVITGFSGAGKSLALDVAEDLGYFSMDNLPPSLLGKFVDLAIGSPNIHKVAVVMDTRGGVFFSQLHEAIQGLKERKIRVRILFLLAQERVIVARYKEKRRPHPMGESIVDGYRKEMRDLEPIKNQADFVLDTSELSNADFKSKLRNLLENKEEAPLRLNIVSFGFKYGNLQDADLIFDVRFLPNPYYIPELKNLDGRCKETRDYVFSQDQTKIFLDKLQDLFRFLIPYYIQEGKRQLVVGLGCTGGFHRSVAMAIALADALKDLDLSISVRHRELS